MRHPSTLGSELNSPRQPENGWLLVFIAALVVIAAIGGLQ